MENTTLPRRLGAMLYDSVLMVAILFAVTLPVVMVLDDYVAPGDPLYRLLLVAVSYAFFVGFWYRYGRTLGMQSWGLRVEGAGGERPTLVQCSVRFVVALVSLLAFGAGFLWQLVDPDGLTWHDRASGTRLRWYPRSRQEESA